MFISSAFSGNKSHPAQAEPTAKMESVSAPGHLTELRSLTAAELAAVAGGPELQVGEGG